MALEHKKPQTPVHRFHWTGVYPKNLTFNRWNARMATGGNANRVEERNRDFEVEIKPITQKRAPSARNYIPDKALDPFNRHEHLDREVP